MMKEFLVLGVILVIGLIVALILELGSYILSKRIIDKEKVTEFECGFESFSDSRNRFDVSFYLIGMLFIVFDLEAMFLYSVGDDKREFRRCRFVWDVRFYNRIDNRYSLHME